MKLTTAKLCLLALVALATLLALSACGKSNNNNNNTNNAPSNQTPAAGGATKEITVNAVDWSYSEPEIKANVGDTLKITLHNEKGVHGLMSEDLGVDLKDGETATVKLDKAGTFEFHCSIQCGQGHDNMVGQIVVQ